VGFLFKCFHLGLLIFGRLKILLIKEEEDDDDNDADEKKCTQLSRFRDARVTVR